MKTEELIASFAAAPVAAPLNPRRIGMQMMGAVALAAAMFLLIAGPRDDLWPAISRPVVVAKTLLPMLVCGLTLPICLRLTRPGRAPELRPLLLPLAVAVALWLGTFALRAPETRFADVTGLALIECVGLILAISAIPAALALRWLASGATVAPRLTGALAGLAISAGAAGGYSLFCVQDNPLFYLTWYGFALALVTGAGAMAGGRMLRW